MTTTTICVTVLCLAAVAAWLIRSNCKDQNAIRRLGVDRQAAAEASTSELADAVRAVRRVAERLAPAPTRTGRPTTIHTHDHLTITGVVLDEYEDRTRLTDARLVTSAGEQPVPGGVATILKANESWRQEHGG
jgi:hypothetical protein